MNTNIIAVAAKRAALVRPLCGQCVTIAYSDAYFRTFSSKGAWTNIGTPPHDVTKIEQLAYCVQTSKTEPMNDQYYEVVFNVYAVRRGLEIIIQNSYTTTTNGFTDSEARHATANAILFFSVDCGEPYIPA